MPTKSNMYKEFKEFAARGNVIDMAVGVIIGSAFGKIVSSLVNDVVMPPIGLLLGKVNFAGLFVTLSDKHYPSLEAAKAAGAPTINYGVFINNVIDFLIVAFVIFLVVRQVNKMKRTPPPTMKECPYCKSKIALNAIRCPECTSQLEGAKT